MRINALKALIFSCFHAIMKNENHLGAFERAFESLETSPQAFSNRHLYDTWANLRLEYSAAKGLKVLWFFLMVLFRRR